MGNCFSIENSERRKSLIISKEIDKQLSECEKQDRNVVKILILGTGESGKSTLVKQMKIIHSDGYTQQELMNFRVCIASIYTTLLL